MRFPTFRGLLLLALLPAAPALAQSPADARPTQDPFGRPLAPEVPGGRYKSHRYQDGILTVYATDGSARQVQPWADGVVKISYFAPGRRPVADSSVSVVQGAASYKADSLITVFNEFDARRYGYHWISPGKLRFMPPQPLRQREAASATATAIYLTTEGSIVAVDKATLAISIEDSYSPSTLFAEAAPAYRRQPRQALADTDDTPPGRADELAGTGVRVRLRPGERLYGTGARALPLDRRGYRLELYNQAHYGYQNGQQNLNVALPVVLSSRGYLLLFDHYAAAYLDLGKKHPDALEYGVQGLNSLSYFVVTGQSQAEILSRYTALTGRQPLPPRWALGLIQSRFGYRSQAEMLDVARRMRAADFPLDALVLDLYWFGGTTRQGDFRWDAANFPDPAGMMRELAGQGVKTVLISEPYVMRTSLNDSLVRTRGLVGTTAAGRPYTVGSFWAGPASILDVFRPDTRAWLWAQYRRLHEQGAAGWWSDLGEPENHPLPMHHALGTTPQVHNAYGITWAKILQDGYAREYPQERLFNLARSGWAGMQRNSVFPWSGDINRSWSGLRAQVPIMLGMGQAGVGYMHSDAGGFGANAHRDPELYTRWLQLAALCPVMRPHSDQVVPPEPYTYPEPYQSIVRKYAHLRYELLPYLYTLAAENTLTGTPLARALDFGPESEEFASNTFADSMKYSITTISQDSVATTQVPPSERDPRHLPPPDDEYLLGPYLLVAPVSQPGQRRRNVYLPATPGGWVDFETGQTVPGGQLAGLPAPLAHIPLLARAGSLVPSTTYRSSTSAYRADTLRVRYFPDEQAPSSDFMVYEDDGHSAQALAQRQYAATQLTSRYNPLSSEFYVFRAGSYPGRPSQLTVSLRVMRVAAAPTVIALNGQPLHTDAWQYDASQHQLLVSFTVGENASLTIENLRLLTRPAPGLDPDPVVLLQPESREFSQQAELRYERFLPGAAALRVRDAQGQLVRELPLPAAPGAHTLAWDGLDARGRPAPAGVYAVELGGQHQWLVRLPE